MDPERKHMLYTLDAMCQATSAQEALTEVSGVMKLGNGSLNLWAYAYMRMLYAKQPDVYHDVLMQNPSTLLPVVYTPTVGAACQNFGKMPLHRRGCYLSVQDRGRFKEILADFAAHNMPKTRGGKPVV